MPARNRLWMNFEEILSDASERLMDITARIVQRNTLRHWASLGNREFARRSEILKGTYLTTLVAGQKFYDLPVDCIRVRLIAVRLPGETGERLLKPLPEEEWLDGKSDVTGWPDYWYLEHDRQRFAIQDKPSSGGFRGRVVSSSSGTVFIGPSEMNVNDDFYNPYVVRILSGTSQGDEREIDDYTGSTREVTVGSSFSNTLDPGDLYEIYPDTIRVEYIKGGNAYSVLKTTGALQADDVTPAVNTFETTLAQKERDWYKGLELKLTDGPAIGERTRVVTSRWVNSATDHTLVTVFPELPVAPVDGDALQVIDIPNIPPAYHDALVSYLVHKALQRERHPDASQHLATFLELVDEAVQRDRPADDQEFKQISEYGRGEEDWRRW